MARRLLKRLLLMSALLTVLLLFSWPHLTRLTQRPLSHPPQITTLPLSELDKNTMRAQVRSLQFQGQDKHQQTYQIDAQQVVESSDARLEITQPRLSVRLSSGDRVTLAAQRGLFDKKSQTLTLKENVILTHSHGYTFRTNKAVANINEATVYSHAPLAGQGPQGQMHAPEGFRFDYTTQKLTLQGRPRVTYSPSSHAPTTVQADQIICQERAQHMCIASGNVLATSQPTNEQAYTLSAEKFLVYFHATSEKNTPASTALQSPQEIQQIDATGQVVFTQGSHQASCEHAQYNPYQEEIRLSGSVKIQHGRSTLEGKEGTVHLKDGTYAVTGHTTPTEALIYPKELPQRTEKAS